MDNVPLELMVHWLSKDMVTFEVDAEVYEKYAKM